MFHLDIRSPVDLNHFKISQTIQLDRQGIARHKLYPQDLAYNTVLSTCRSYLFLVLFPFSVNNYLISQKLKKKTISVQV